MAVTDQSDLVPRRRVGDEAAPAPEDEPGRAADATAVEVRLRTESGHCCDGRPCDHPAHGPADADGGVIHFIL
jgi:hypothetical protein